MKDLSKSELWAEVKRLRLNEGVSYQKATKAALIELIKAAKPAKAARQEAGKGTVGALIAEKPRQRVKAGSSKPQGKSAANAKAAALEVEAFKEAARKRHERDERERKAAELESLVALTQQAVDAMAAQLRRAVATVRAAGKPALADRWESALALL